MMPRPRKKTERWAQVLRYLQVHFPTPFPVQLRFEEQEKGQVAECYELQISGPRMVYLSIDPKRTLSDGLHDVIHEYAHAMTWPVSKPQFDQYIEHSPEFWAAYGRVYTDFFDETGAADSSDY
jgi:hypothetical protein